jgi:hypothetical protein
MALGLAEVFVRRVLPEVTREDKLSGETLYDPMCGSGTALLAARAAGMKVCGSDLLPTSVVIAAAKLNRLPAPELRRLNRFLTATHLSGCKEPLWSWPGSGIWFTPVALRAVQDIRLGIDRHRTRSCFPHLLTALSWTTWDVSSADRHVMVPTHSSWSPWNRATRPRRVEARFRRRLQAIIRAQGALSELNFSEARVRVWKGNALERATWPGRPRFVLTSPPYGLGIDYVRAASLQWHILFPRVPRSDARATVLGRVRASDADPDSLPKRFQSQRWWTAMCREQPDRAAAFLVYLSELSTFLEVAGDRIATDGVLGVAIGDPQTCRRTIPLTEITRRLASRVGLEPAFPDVSSRLRRRFQSRSRRSSSRPIQSETLLTFAPS